MECAACNLKKKNFRRFDTESPQTIRMGVYKGWPWGSSLQMFIQIDRLRSVIIHLLIKFVHVKLQQLIKTFTPVKISQSKEFIFFPVFQFLQTFLLIVELGVATDYRGYQGFNQCHNVFVTSTNAPKIKNKTNMEYPCQYNCFSLEDVLILNSRRSKSIKLSLFLSFLAKMAGVPWLATRSRSKDCVTSGASQNFRDANFKLIFNQREKSTM